MTSQRPLSPLQIATITHPILTPQTPLSPSTTQQQQQQHSSTIYTNLAQSLKDGNTKQGLEKVEGWIESLSREQNEKENKENNVQNTQIVEKELWNQLAS